MRVSGVVADISVFERRPTHDHLHKMRCRLAKDGKISFDKRTKRWKCNAVKARNLTEKEGRFLKAKGLGLGWVLSPAFDMNPSATGEGLTLNISRDDNAQDLDLARSVAPIFRIGEGRA